VLRNRRSFLTALLMLLACGGEGGEPISDARQSAAPDPGAGDAAPEAVCASVRIEAEQEALLFGTGRITEVLVGEGDSVRTGQILVGLSGDRLAASAVSARADEVEAARITALNSEREFERCSGLFQAGALSAMQLEGAQTAMIAAGSALQEARAGVSGALSGQSALTVQAPFDGAVGRVWAREGNLAGDDPLVMLTGGDGYIVRALLPEREIGWIEPGTPAVFVTSSLAAVSFEGTVTSVSASLDPVTCLLPVTVRITDTEGLLAPGLYGTLSISRGRT
jgi:membrane fusion protein, multidrug efflux system